MFDYKLFMGRSLYPINWAALISITVDTLTYSHHCDWNCQIYNGIWDAAFISIFTATKTFSIKIHLFIKGFVYFIYRWLFWRMEQNHSPNSHQKIWRTNSLRMDALLGVISDIHMVHTNPWMSKMTSRKASIHKSFVLQIFLCEFG